MSPPPADSRAPVASLVPPPSIRKPLLLTAPPVALPSASVPPPMVMLPPLVMTCAFEPSDTAPVPPPEAEFSTTLSAPPVETMVLAELRMTSRLATSVSVRASAPV